LAIEGHLPSQRGGRRVGAIIGDVDVTVYWRPGCGFCSSLRRDLERRGVDAMWVNIWEDDSARAFVRSVAAGNETVPTVMVGDVALVNPGGGAVAAALGV
jgi:glutaredoxin-like protein